MAFNFKMLASFATIKMDLDPQYERSHITISDHSKKNVKSKSSLIIERKKQFHWLKLKSYHYKLNEDCVNRVIVQCFIL